MGRKGRSPSRANVVFGWVRRQSMKVKIFVGATLGLCALAALKLTIKITIISLLPLKPFMPLESSSSFISSPPKTLALVFSIFTAPRVHCGLSLKCQELTAMFLAVRLFCSTIMEGDIHTLLDLTTLLSTTWVIYMIRFKLNSTYIKELDNFPYIICRIFWAFGVYMESLSVLPQLRLMQKAKMIEPFTAHYIFALGVSRFLACAHWIIQIYETRGRYLYMFGSGYLWFLSAFLAEMVQSFVLADFCYYYIKSFMQGQLMMRMPI
ncbi:hypothetical protein FNV43_RR23033 [Rhamnella rubrinervis]|uniref:ER lumen protein-retaining receptor n=1 Tax=Rhamnella rubrinervis TaxID=2594499 RepID=A0A8K0GSK7_9ROSA|nr:hypothetical protein FNV43_RR23033 [Rhamnella rubrinervis]